ncbi:MAG: type II toxin-antitoxin system RelE/ParE family toxin [Alkalinema sp. RU_4_3]|nr:type II toxin-antitoxin system RelE/ParE family toxin [Alkalinema sp. RU_4_3]
MEIEYRQSFLKDLKHLRGTEVYARVYELTFTELPETETLQDVPNVKALKGYSNRYRIRIGDYRIGIEVSGDAVEIIRVLHRREFYRYFP